MTQPASATGQRTVRTNSTAGSVLQLAIQPITFRQLWINYVSGNPYDDPTGAYSNQCAIRISTTLHRVGVDMKSFSSKNVSPVAGKTSIGRIIIDGKITATRADELAQWLSLVPFAGLPGKPENVTGSDWESRVHGRTGIIYFGGYWTRDGESDVNASGGHIDLWNGEKMTGFGTGVRARWGIVIPGIWSDLRKSKVILFFPMR